MEAVAQRAGVHKATVYRRSGTLDGLLVDALALFTDRSVAMPDTGGIDGDLRELARAARARGRPVGGQWAAGGTGVPGSAGRLALSQPVSHIVTRSPPRTNGNVLTGACARP